MTTPSLSAVEALLRDFREQVKVASQPTPEGEQVVTWQWLDDWLAGKIGTFQDGPLRYDGPPVPERIRRLTNEAATSVEALREALSWALDVLDITMKRLATVSPSDALNVHPAFHAGSVKARAALLASAGEAPRVDNEWVDTIEGVPVNGSGSRVEGPSRCPSCGVYAQGEWRHHDDCPLRPTPAVTPPDEGLVRVLAILGNHEGLGCCDPKTLEHVAQSARLAFQEQSVTDD